MRAVFLLHRQVKAKQELLIYYLIQILCVYDLKIFSEIKYYFIDFPLVGEIITAINISRNSKLSPDSIREGEKCLHN